MSFSEIERINITTKALLGILGTGNNDSAPDNIAIYEELYAIDTQIAPYQYLADIGNVPYAGNLAAAQAAAASNPTLIADYSNPANAIHCTPSPNNKAFFLTSTYNDLSTRLRNFINPVMIQSSSGNASIGYMLKLYNGNPNSGGTEIPTTLGQEGASTAWWYLAGPGVILTSSDFTGITDPTDVWATGFQYIGNTGAGGSGSDTIEIVYDYTCENSAAVGNIVYPSTTGGKVEYNINNIAPQRSIGVIIYKNGTQCKVLHKGKCTISFVGITNIGSPVFLSSGGGVTHTKPISGYAQKLGYCYDTNKIFFDPDTIRVKLST